MSPFHTEDYVWVRTSEHFSPGLEYQPNPQSPRTKFFPLFLNTALFGGESEGLHEEKRKSKKVMNRRNAAHHRNPDVAHPIPAWSGKGRVVLRGNETTYRWVTERVGKITHYI